MIDDIAYPLVTSTYAISGSGEGKHTARDVIGGTGLGALIGGLAGGGKGAGIGALARMVAIERLADDGHGRICGGVDDACRPGVFRHVLHVTKEAVGAGIPIPETDMLDTHVIEALEHVFPSQSGKTRLACSGVMTAIAPRVTGSPATAKHAQSKGLPAFATNCFTIDGRLR